MSKQVKGLVERDIRQRLAGAGSCVVVDYRGLRVPEASALRHRLRQSGVRVLVVKNSLARRALSGGPLASAAPLLTGPSAICWGGEDPAVLARVVQESAPKEGPWSVRGACVDGRTLSAAQVADLANLPSRPELVAGVVALALAPARRVVALALGAIQRVAGQIKVLAERPETDGP